MRHRKTHLIISFIFVLAFTLFFNCGKVRAATAIKTGPKLYYTAKNISSGAVLSSRYYVEGILKVNDTDGTHYVFCFDFMNKFPANQTVVKLTDEDDMVEAFANYGFCDLKWNSKYGCKKLSKAQAGALLKKIALYLDYLKSEYSEHHINGKQLMFYGQATVWTLVSGAYYGTPDTPQVSYMVDTDLSQTHFGISNSASLDKQIELWNGATAYYNEHKDSAGELNGTIWYKPEASGVYSSRKSTQAMFDINFTIEDIPNECVGDECDDPEPEIEPVCVDYVIVGTVRPDATKRTDPTPEEECYEKGIKYTQEPELTTEDTNCTFNGWYTSYDVNAKTLSGKWTDGTALESDLTLYGAWECSTKVEVPPTAASASLIILGIGLASIAIGAGVYIYKEKKINSNK